MLDSLLAACLKLREFLAHLCGRLSVCSSQKGELKLAMKRARRKFWKLVRAHSFTELAVLLVYPARSLLFPSWLVPAVFCAGAALSSRGSLVACRLRESGVALIRRPAAFSCAVLIFFVLILALVRGTGSLHDLLHLPQGVFPISRSRTLRLGAPL